MKELVRASTLQFRAPVVPTTYGGSAFLSHLQALQLELNKAIDEKRGPKTARPYIGVMIDETRNLPLPMPIYAQEGGHILTIAPTRAGKGVGQIIPNLHSWPYSLMILDVKGENYSKSAGYRERVLGHRIVKYSPFERDTHRLNPVMCIPIDDEAEAEEWVDYITDLACPVAPSSKDAFFDEWGPRAFGATLLYVRTAPLDGDPSLDSPAGEAAVRERSMAEVDRLLHLSAAPFKALLLRMQHSPFTLVKQTAAALGQFFSGSDNRTGLSILGSAQRHSVIWGRKRIRKASYVPGPEGSREPGENEIDFAALRDGKTSIYLVVPPDSILKYQAVLRVLIGVAIRKMRLTQKGSAEKPRVLMMLDEFPQLGHMAPVEQSLLYMAGYGLTYWFFAQSLTDLERYYPESYRNFLANTSTQCFYSVSDQETAEYVSQLAGMTTVHNEGYSNNVSQGEAESTTHSSGTSSGSGGSSSNSGTSDTYSTNRGISMGRSMSYVGRQLILPDEVRTLSANAQLIFMRNTPPIMAHKPAYYEIQKYREAAAIPAPQEIDWDS